MSAPKVTCLKPLASSRALVPTAPPSAPHRKTFTRDSWPDGDRSQPLDVPVENGLADPAPPPGGVEKCERLIDMLTVLLLLPPDPGIPDRLPVDLDE